MGRRTTQERGAGRANTNNDNFPAAIHLPDDLADYGDRSIDTPVLYQPICRA